MGLNGLLEKEIFGGKPSKTSRNNGWKILESPVPLLGNGKPTNPSCRPCLVSCSQARCTHNLIPIELHSVSSSHSLHTPSALTMEIKFPWKETPDVTFCTWGMSNTITWCLFLPFRSPLKCVPGFHMFQHWPYQLLILHNGCSPRGSVGEPKLLHKFVQDGPDWGQNLCRLVSSLWVGNRSVLLLEGWFVCLEK